MHPSFIQRSQVNTTTAGVATVATALAAFNDRVGLILQNQAATPLFVKFGAGCTTSVYDIVLPAAGVAASGSDAPFVMGLTGPVVYTGIVTVASATTPSYTAIDW